MVGIYTILALSLNLLIGYSGIFSLAHAAIYGIGAYASALVALKLGLGFWGGLVVAGAAGAFASALVAIPSLRVAGDYYIVASFGLQIVMLTVFMNWTASDQRPRRPARHSAARASSARSSTTRSSTCCWRLAFAAFTYAVCRRLTHSAFGRMLQAIRDDEIAAQAIGKNVVQVKIVIATISSALGAMAGSLYAHYITYINPTSFTLQESIFIASLVILGGTRAAGRPDRRRVHAAGGARGAQVPRHPGHGRGADAADHLRRAADPVHVRAARRHPRPRARAGPRSLQGPQR